MNSHTNCHDNVIRVNVNQSNRQISQHWVPTICYYMSLYVHRNFFTTIIVNRLQNCTSALQAYKSESSSFDAPVASSVVILKLHRITARRGAARLSYLSLALNTACCNGADLSGSRLTICCLRNSKSSHTVHACPLFSQCSQQQSVLDWFRLEKPWQTQRIVLQFLSSAAFSKWIPI